MEAPNSHKQNSYQPGSSPVVELDGLPLLSASTDKIDKIEGQPLHATYEKTSAAISIYASTGLLMHQKAIVQALETICPPTNRPETMDDLASEETRDFYSKYIRLSRRRNKTTGDFEIPNNYVEISSNIWQVLAPAANVLKQILDNKPKSEISIEEFEHTVNVLDALTELAEQDKL